MGKKLPLAVKYAFTYNSHMSLTWKRIDDPAVWELFVLRYSPNALFQSWMWGEVQVRLGVLLTRHGLYEDGELIGVMQLAKVNAKRGSFLHVRHGPIFAKNSLKVWKSAQHYLTDLAKKEGCFFVRISPLLLPSPQVQEILDSLHMRPAAIHRMDGEYCWVLDLDPTEDQLLSSMRKTTRYEIRKAEKDGVKITKTTDPKNLREFFNLYTATSKRQGFVPHTGIQEEFEVFAKKNQAVLYIGKVNKETVAAALILYYGNQAIYHHGASIYSKAPVSSALQWEAIRDAKKRGMKVYNFWGIAPENSANHPWRGITLFKKGFGGRNIEYIHAQDLVVSPLYIIPRTIEMVRRIIKGYD